MHPALFHGMSYATPSCNRDLCAFSRLSVAPNPEGPADAGRSKGTNNVFSLTEPDYRKYLGRA